MVTQRSNSVSGDRCSTPGPTWSVGFSGTTLKGSVGSDQDGEGLGILPMGEKRHRGSMSLLSHLPKEGFCVSGNA